MGKWNRRYFPRRNYNYQYQEFPPTDYDDESHPVIQENSVPSWEIDFCKSMGMPWHKVVNAKKSFSCYDNVVKWDDSASQETFNDAKSRYWAMINDQPCDNPLPDPCKYIDEVDWDAKIDPDMIFDLERQLYNPDELEANNLEQGTGILEAGQSSARWDDSKNLKNVDNPWEENHTRTGGSSKSTGWRGAANDSWGQNASSGWNHESGGVGCTSQNDWGNNKNSLWSRNDDWGNSMARGGGAPKKDRSRQWENNCRNWKRTESQSNQPPYTGRDSFYGGSKKRECPSSYHASSFKRSRFQGDGW